MRAVGSYSPRGPLLGPLFFQNFDSLATFLNFLMSHVREVGATRG